MLPFVFQIPYICFHISMWDTCKLFQEGSLCDSWCHALWIYYECVYFIPPLCQTSLWFIAVLKFPLYSLFGFLSLKPFEVNDLLQGLNFSKVLNSLVALNKATEGKIAVCVCVRAVFVPSLQTFGLFWSLFLFGHPMNLRCVQLHHAFADLSVSGDTICVAHSSTSRIKSFDSLNTQSRSLKLVQPQYRSLVSNHGKDKNSNNSRQTATGLEILLCCENAV